MKYLIISLFLFLWGHFPLSGHPCHIGTGECNNIVLGQKDSVLRERIYSNRFERISIVHAREESLTDLKRHQHSTRKRRKLNRLEKSRVLGN